VAVLRRPSWRIWGGEEPTTPYEEKRILKKARQLIFLPGEPPPAHANPEKEEARYFSWESRKGGGAWGRKFESGKGETGAKVGLKGPCQQKIQLDMTPKGLMGSRGYVLQYSNWGLHPLRGWE